MATGDPVLTALRNRQPAGLARRGFDIGIGATGGQTLWGPGKQGIHDALSPIEGVGFMEAATFAMARNNNADLATRGAAIALVDPVITAARTPELAGLYWLGYDVATGLFGDPALRGLGHTSIGPGAEKIRSSLGDDGARGFNAAVTLHLSRDYTH